MLGWVIFLACVCASFASMGTPELFECAPSRRRESTPFVSALEDLSIQVSDCDNPNQCLLIRNTTHTVKFTFKAKENTPNLRMEVYGQVMRVRVPYVRKVDLCKDATSTDGQKCLGQGLIAGKTYVVEYPFHIRARFPEWNVPVEFELFGGNKKLSCTQVKIKIQCNQVTERNCKKT